MNTHTTMASKLNTIALLLLSLATMLNSSSAQTNYNVGGTTGWTVPPGGASTYSSWSSNQTFKQGDTLVFNFVTGQHDVAKVTKAAFDACSTGNTIFTLNNGPASVKLNESGEQYYICTFGSHCSLGQKVAINVTKEASSSASPAPAPQTKAVSPAPVKAPSPAPSASAPSPSSTGSVTYTVGDKTGWTVPSGAPAFYKTWTSGKTFKLGDILVFNFQKNIHDVAEVTKANYDSCNTSSPIAIYNTPPVRVTLNTSGDHYYICAVPGHCAGGQKLAVNVGGASSPATSPSPSPSPSPAISPPSPSASAPGSTASSPSSSGTTNPSSPSPSGSASPPPPNSGATSYREAGLLLATLLWISAALLC